MDQISIRMSKQAKNIALFTLFFLILIHGYRYFSPMYSHDSLAFAAESDVEWKISLGRFLQPVYWKFRGQIAAPYIIGLLTYLWLTLSIYLVSDLLNIKSSVSQFLLSGAMVGSLALVCTNAAYIHEADTFMLALFLNVFAAWACLKPTRKLWLLAPVLVMMAAALYQAFIQAYVALVMIWAIMQILEREGVTLHTLKKCMGSALILLLGMVLYAAAWKFVLDTTGIQPESGYNGLTGVGDYEGVSVFGLLKETWIYPLLYLKGIKCRNYWLVFVPRVCILIYAFCAVIYALIKQQRSILEMFAAIMVVAMLPAGMNCMYFVSKGLVHDLIVYAYCFADVFAIATVEYAVSLTAQKRGFARLERLKKSVICVFALLLCIVYFDKTLYANQIYLKKDLEYDSTLSVMTRVVDRLEQLDGYQSGHTPVVLYGSVEKSVVNRENPAFSGVKAVTGFYSDYAVTYEDTYWWYFEDIMGYSIAKHEQAEEIRRLAQVQDMPAFPEKGCVQMIDDVAVIKLSE